MSTTVGLYRTFPENNHRPEVYQTISPLHEGSTHFRLSLGLNVIVH